MELQVMKNGSEEPLLYTGANETPAFRFGCESVAGQVVEEKDASAFTRNFPAPSATPRFEAWEIAVKIIFYLISFLMDIVGNTIVLLIIYLNKRMHSTTNCLIMNLALSDIMVGVFCMWVHLGNQLSPEWPFGAFVCKANTFIQVVAVTSSVLSLTVISGDRFMAIVFPLRARMTPTTASGIIAVTWIISVGVAMPQLVVRKQSELVWVDRHEVWCGEVWPKVYTNSRCDTSQHGRKIYYLLVIVVLYFIPIGVMIIAYSVILRTILKRKVPGTLINSTVLAQEKAKKKVIKMLVAVLAVFIICWSPHQILNLWGLFRTPKLLPKHVDTVQYVALYVAFLNSALNPIIYCGFNENFRRGFVDAFKCMLLKKNRVMPIRAETAHTGADSGMEKTRLSSYNAG